MKTVTNEKCLTGTEKLFDILVKTFVRIIESIIEFRPKAKLFCRETCSFSFKQAETFGGPVVLSRGTEVNPRYTYYRIVLFFTHSIYTSGGIRVRVWATGKMFSPDEYAIL